MSKFFIGGGEEAQMRTIILAAIAAIGMGGSGHAATLLFNEVTEGDLPSASPHVINLPSDNLYGDFMVVFQVVAGDVDWVKIVSPIPVLMTGTNSTEGGNFPPYGSLSYQISTFLDVDGFLNITATALPGWTYPGPAVTFTTFNVAPIPTPVVPLPASALLLLAGAGALTLVRRRS